MIVLLFSVGSRRHAVWVVRRGTRDVPVVRVSEVSKGILEPGLHRGVGSVPRGFNRHHDPRHPKRSARSHRAER